MQHGDGQNGEAVVLYDAARKPSRHCGDCQLCCKLMPVEEFEKPASCRCAHQRTGKGCAIYRNRPLSCQLWNCRWLVDRSTADLPRPDRAHYVLDLIPDFVTIQPHDGSPARHFEVVQVWCDAAFPDAHRAPSFRAWLNAQATCALIRYDSRRAFLLAPPSVTGDDWHEQHSETSRTQCTLQEKARILGGTLRVQTMSDDGAGSAVLEVGGKALPIAYTGKLPTST